MKRKIIIKSDDFNREIFSFLKEVGANMPIDWNIEALDRIRNAVIEAYEKMGVTLEIDDRLQSVPSSNKGGHDFGEITKPLPRSCLKT